MQNLLYALFNFHTFFIATQPVVPQPALAQNQLVAYCDEQTQTGDNTSSSTEEEEDNEKEENDEKNSYRKTTTRTPIKYPRGH